MRRYVGHHRRWCWGLALLGVAAAMTVGGAWLLGHSRHFAVRSIVVSPLAHTQADRLIARSRLEVGTNLFAFDRGEVARLVSREPWVASVKVRRELPSRVRLEVVEREAACLVALESLYLSDRDGRLFKRATPAEAMGLPVVTGLLREDYAAQPEHLRPPVRQALALVAEWERGGRPPIGEIHIERSGAFTLYTQGGLGVRLGAIDASLAARLRRYDAVRASLAASGERPRFIYLDHRARPDRVTVKLASAARPAPSETRD